MLFSELKVVHNAIAAYQSRSRYAGDTIDINIKFTDGQIVPMSLGRYRTFDLDILADQSSKVKQIVHSSGAPLEIWLKQSAEKGDREFYNAIDNAVNGWIDRVSALEGAEVIHEKPAVDRHYIMIGNNDQTSYPKPVQLRPFSFAKMKSDYYTDFSGYSVPQSTSIESLFPTQEEAEQMFEHNLYFKVFLSKTVIRPITRHHVVRFYPSGFLEEEWYQRILADDHTKWIKSE